jgi:hypothetical protein
MTLSDVYAVPTAAAVPAAGRITLEKKAGARVRAGARDASVPRVTAFRCAVWADLRAAWWLPSSIPTVRRAWAQRVPDRDRVPGNSDLLYNGWLVWNHTIGLAVPVAATVIAGILAPLVFIAAHPARFALAALLVSTLIAAITAA